MPLRADYEEFQTTHTEAFHSLVTKKMCFCKTVLNTERVKKHQLQVF